MSNVGEFLARFVSWGLHPSLERERKFRRLLFTSSIIREIRHFHVVVVQWRQRNVQRSVMHVQSCCFAYQTHCFFGFLVAVTVAVVVAKAPYCLNTKRRAWLNQHHYIHSKWKSQSSQKTEENGHAAAHERDVLECFLMVLIKFVLGNNQRKWLPSSQVKRTSTPRFNLFNGFIIQNWIGW